MSKEKRHQMIDNKHPTLSLVRQCELLTVNRSTLYYKPVATSEVNVDLINQVRDIWHAHPFYGYRRITAALQRLGYSVNRKRIKRLMGLLGLEAIYPKPNTSKADSEARKYPYLLHEMSISAPNQVWCVDITYLKLDKGFMYLTALIDRHSRYIVGWCLSNTLDTEHCLEALEAGLTLATPEIINSDHVLTVESSIFLKKKSPSPHIGVNFYHLVPSLFCLLVKSFYPGDTRSVVYFTVFTVLKTKYKSQQNAPT